MNTESKIGIWMEKNLKFLKQGEWRGESGDK